jgi:hypothetical protein
MRSLSGPRLSSRRRPGERLPVHRGGEGAAAQHARACELLKVSRAAYYAAHGGKPSDREREDAELAGQIKTVHEDSKGRYGAPRVHAELRSQGRRHSRKRIARLMRTAGLRGRAAKRWKKTTVPDPAARADAIRRDFELWESSTDSSLQLRVLQSGQSRV